MAPSRQPLILAITLIVLGSGWLLNNLQDKLQITPDVNWIWTLGLGIVGAVVFALGGINKFTVVVAPFLITASALSYLRQSGRLDAAYELPGLVLFLGLLILLAHGRKIPAPPWLQQTKQRPDE
ncbi:MAG TPA: hypothetical protein VG125_31135 [Pirellulales bacterium]|jgi:hypothetical protein|nr:hypothetical protein [Pirellulales bacterium]